jgi:SAM-dependent methyltransferase
MYDEFARYYDVIHEELTDDIDFVLSLAEKIGGPILELGCGTGRLAIPLARAGYRVTGLDNSTEMLAFAKHKLSSQTEIVKERARLLVGDMRRFELDDQFALAVISYNTFMHLDRKGAEESLRCVRDHLSSDGWLLIDGLNPFALKDISTTNIPELERELLDQVTGNIIRQFSCSSLEEETQELNITWTYEIVQASGSSVRRFVVDSTFYYLFPHQAEILLSSAGFGLEALYGDYGREAFTEDSDHMLLMARPT